MKRRLTIKNHRSLKIELAVLKKDMVSQENEIKLSATSFMTRLPLKIFTATPKRDPLTNLPIIKNPTGKFLAKAVNKTILRKQNFLVKFFSGLLLKRIGKTVENKLLKT